MRDVFDLIVAGAGASGMIAAVRAAERGRKVLLTEKSDRPGRKILASGNGRCNLMNNGNLRYYGSPEFACEVISHCTAESLSAYFQHLGLFTFEETEGRVYPYSCQSATVLNVLKAAMELNKVQMVTETKVLSVQKQDRMFTVRSTKGIYYSEKLIVSCGGAAQPKLGGSADGYLILQSMGHTITQTGPALVPLETGKKCISGLSGIRAGCKVCLYKGEQLIHSETGEVLFTDYGISGICIMQCARFIKEDMMHLEIDFLYRTGSDQEMILQEIYRRREMFCEMSPVFMLEGILAGRIAYAVLKQAGISLHGETAGDLSDSELRSIMHTAKHYTVEIHGTRGIDFAQVTYGGADCSVFNPSARESRIVPGLYATGEVLNVDGDCGGFNLMFAFSSGLIAGNSI